VIANGEGRLSFALLDRRNGVPEPGPALGDEYPLAAWYRAVREVPLEELTVEDISKAVRQNVHLENVVPLALRLLASEPLAGEMYDGELLASLKAVPAQYWLQHQDERRSLQGVAEAALRSEVATEDVRRDAQDLLRTAAEGQ
jgi:hypothetical protein